MTNSGGEDDFARDEETLAMVAEMDPSRRELYVEGTRDRAFFMRLSSRSRNAEIVLAQFLRTSPGEGGERGRLLRYFRDARPNPALMGFVDADWDRVLGQAAHLNITLTDHRDLESYGLCVDCFNHVLTCGVGSQQDARVFLRHVEEIGREVAAVRIASERTQLKLPFQHTDLTNYLRWKANVLELRREAFLDALIQNAMRRGATVTMKDKPSISAECSAAILDLAPLPARDVLHGKDQLIISEFLAHKWLGAASGAFTAAFSMAFVREHATAFPALMQVLGFLEAQ